MIEISKGVYVTDVEKFTTVYNARCESVSVLSEGVIERKQLYDRIITKNDSINEKDNN